MGSKGVFPWDGIPGGDSWDAQGGLPMSCKGGLPMESQRGGLGSQGCAFGTWVLRDPWALEAQALGPPYFICGFTLVS